MAVETADGDPVVTHPAEPVTVGVMHGNDLVTESLSRNLIMEAASARILSAARGSTGQPSQHTHRDLIVAVTVITIRSSARSDFTVGGMTVRIVGPLSPAASPHGG